MSEHIKPINKDTKAAFTCNVIQVCSTSSRPEVVPCFKEQHPDIQLNVSTNSREQIQESLLNASADYGV